jgi:SDR family mycofactocin-dependent oxidoreductase
MVGVGLLDGKVGFVTGAGRGQGRNHAVRMAAEGADLMVVDIGSAQVRNPDYPTATAADLKQTVELVEQQGRSCLAAEVDVRDFDGLRAAADEVVAQFGHLDCVVANAGIGDAFFPLWEIPNTHWQTMIDINLTGVFNTCKATVPQLRATGRNASLVLVSSAAAFKAVGYFAHYNAAKAGVASISATLAKELGPDGIRCNSLHPGAILTPMTEAISSLSGVSKEHFLRQFTDSQLLDRIGAPDDTTAAVVWLLSNQAAHVTGLEMRVDAGETKK